MKTFPRIWLHLLLLTVILLIKTAASAQLKAGISASPQSGCPPLLVNFKDSSVGNPASWQWDLGNGTISYLQNPTATYFNSGTYDIKLMVKNADGTDTITRSKYIVVNALPVPDFKASATTGCFPLDVAFTDKSIAGSGTIAAWKWDFGDGTLSNEQNPVHTYTNAGSYQIVLRIINSSGCTRTLSKSSYINIRNGVRADFSYVSPAGCHTPTSVNFTNATKGTGTISYMWDFGNGKSSTDPNPVTNYQNPGVYSIRLIAKNSLGCSDTLLKTNAINIGFVKADFSKPDTVCAGAFFQVTNTSSPSTFVGSHWDFGDGTFSDSINSSKSYAASGSHQIKLVTDFGSCSDSTFKSLYVLPQATVSFSATNYTGCTAPLKVTFKNTSVNSSGFLWNFGDGASSTSENPVHTYTKAGSYTVTLTVKNASQCSGTLIKQNFVNILGPRITAINNLPLKACIPTTAKPVAVIKNNIPGSAYLWDFGDNSTSTDSTPSHTYTVPGNYNVKLTITTPLGCTDTLTIVSGVQAGVKPTAQFSGDPLDVCALTPVNFTDLSTGTPAQSWLWKFGDGSTSVLQNPAHGYGGAGKFSVTLIAYNYGCSDTLTKINYVNIRPPIAKYDTAFVCNNPLKRNFIDKSIGATTWLWDFGDGTTLTDKKVSHAYAAPGTYHTMLTVTNGACVNISKKDVVIISEQGAVGINITETCINTKATFNIANVNAANVSSYAWYFDGLSQPSVPALTNPVAFAYNTAGVKFPAAVITDKLNCKDTFYATVPVTIYGSKAAFGSPDPGTCFGNTVNFTDSSKTDGIHAITNWIWNFGEGADQSYTSSPFSHNYSATGDYTVKLTVKDSYGCTDSLTKPQYVSITKPVASFKASDTLICPQAPVVFTNTSTGAGPTYFWQFGDGTTSADISPVHTFLKTGFFTVKMLMTDKNGCTDSATKNVSISTALAAFSLSDSFSNCPPLIVNTTNQSTNFVKINWDFNDGGNSQLINPSHIYTYPGVYRIKLTISNNGGCIDSLTRQVTIDGPTGVFDYTPKEVCNGQTLKFIVHSQNAVSYIWDYDDGTTTRSSDTETTHTYTTPGRYTPRLVLKDKEGCAVPITGIDTVKIDGIKANISSDDVLKCDSGHIAFRDSTVSNDVVTGYLWDFGDGATSTLESPDHSYAKAGFYTITLVAKTLFGCIDTSINEKYIKIVSSPKVRIMGDSAACELSKLSFAAEFLETDTSAIVWSWNFGNGNTANIMKPDPQIFAIAGVYPVTVKATDSDGCYDSVMQQTIIHAKPPVNAGADTAICKAAAYNLKATGADSYTWNADPSLSCTNCASPTVKPAQTTTYKVSGKTMFGCINADSVTVKVEQPFKITVSATDTVCLGGSVVLKATGADLYQWTPSLWLDNPQSATPKSTPDSSMLYTVTATDSLGCFKDQGSVTLKVYPKPAIEITNGDKLIISAGSFAKLVTKNSPDITNWNWDPPKWLSCTTCSEPTSTPRDNITYSVTAFNEGKCEARDEITINVICNNANVYIPNTFSPNHDGINDVFYPRGTGIFTIKSFKIFNRWGQIVFSKSNVNANDPQYGWDGTLNGASLQADVYVYMAEVLCENNITIPLQGNVTLVR